MSRMASCEPERMMTRSRSKRSEDDMLEVLNLYAPAGDRIEVTSSNGRFVFADDKTYRGLQVVVRRGPRPDRRARGDDVQRDRLARGRPGAERAHPPDGAGLPVGEG